MIDNNLLFINIPKTGSVSIRSKLNEIGKNNWKRVLPFDHDPFFIMEKNNKIDDFIFKFCMVRNPFTRTFSYYNHFKVKNNLDVSLIKFLNIIKEKKFFKKTPFILYPQMFFILNLKGEVGINKIYKFENFSELEDDFKIKFEMLNIGSYSKSEFYDKYSQECIDLTLNLFMCDFVNFNYEFDFPK